MTRSNRTLNRLLLALIGIAGLAASAALILVGTGAPVSRPALDTLAAALAEPGVLAATAGGALAVAVLGVAWIVSRGRGGTPIADADADVEITIDAVRDVVASRLAVVPAVLATRADAHRLRGRTVLTITVSTRRRADLEQVLGRVRRALADLDAVLGVAPPVVVRIRSGWRSTLARTQRAE